MKQVPFYPNKADDNHCMVAVYRSIFDYFLGEKYSWDKMDEFIGYKNGRAVWTLAPLTKMADMGFDIRMVEPFDYHAYAKHGHSYLTTLYPKEKAEWLLAHSNILEIQPFIPAFLKAVDWRNRRAALSDIDDMLDDGRLVFVTLNARQLNGRSGYVDHAVLVLDKREGAYIVHDPGLPPKPYREVPRDKLWAAMGGDEHTSEVTGIKMAEKEDE